MLGDPGRSLIVCSFTGKSLAVDHVRPPHLLVKLEHPKSMTPRGTSSQRAASPQLAGLRGCPGGNMRAEPPHAVPIPPRPGKQANDFKAPGKKKLDRSCRAQTPFGACSVFSLLAWKELVRGRGSRGWGRTGERTPGPSTASQEGCSAFLRSHGAAFPRRPREFLP